MDHILTSNHALETIVQSVVPTTVLSSPTNATVWYRALSTSYRELLFTRRIATISISSIDRYIQRQCIANNAYSPILLKSFTSFAPHGNRFHQVIEYLESDARSSERGLGKKKPNEQVDEKRVNEEKDEEGCAKKRRTMEGATENGMMLCGPRVATHLSFFIQANHLRSKMTL